MAIHLPDVYKEKETFSNQRLNELSNRIGDVEAAERINGLTIFAAGSYARAEASEHSDIDLFFISDGERETESRRTNELELFGELIKIGKTMSFPKFSGDARYLEIHPADRVLEELGSREDDYHNFFTLRLLMLLESKPIYGTGAYHRTVKMFVGSYYRDYPDHQATFEPTFLVNDIARFWRTLLANYEHSRNQQGDETERIQQKIRNYKLKYSRLTTCFATIAALASFDTPVHQADVETIVRQTPRERLEFVASQIPDAEDNVSEILNGYAEFLGHTQISKEDLAAQFQDKSRRAELFSCAEAYGDTFFKLIEQLDSVTGRKILRTLVI